MGGLIITSREQQYTYIVVVASKHCCVRDLVRRAVSGFGGVDRHIEDVRGMTVAEARRHRLRLGLDPE